ncbi:MAG: ABC transporter permease, partial [Propionibacteriaceae bacterium]|nr:ABC transporter permease [Propionibacteriaceae bacterium]
IGSLVGIVLGFGLALIGQHALSGLSIAALSIPWIWIVGLFVLCLIAGMLAPIGPAWRAAKLPMRGELVTD